MCKQHIAHTIHAAPPVAPFVACLQSQSKHIADSMVNLESGALSSKTYGYVAMYFCD